MSVELKRMPVMHYLFGAFNPAFKSQSMRSAMDLHLLPFLLGSRSRNDLQHFIGDLLLCTIRDRVSVRGHRILYSTERFVNRNFNAMEFCKLTWISRSQRRHFHSNATKCPPTKTWGSAQFWSHEPRRSETKWKGKLSLYCTQMLSKIVLTLFPLCLHFTRRHRCPHQPLALGRPQHGRCVLSEYKETYKKPPLDFQKASLFRPLQRPQSSYAKLESTTTHTRDFRPHEARPPSPPPPAVYVKPQGPFQKDTEYTAEFPKFDVVEPAPTQYPRDRLRRPTAPLDGRTEQRDQFVKWPLPARKPLTVAWAPAPQAVSAPIDLVTTTGEDFQEKKAERREPAKPPEGVHNSGAPFIEDTTHRTEYTAKNVPFQRSKGPPTQAPGKKIPLRTKSTTHETYKHHHGDHRALSCKPPADAHRQTDGITPKTTHQKAFPAWKYERPTVHEIEPYQPPTGDFDDATTHGKTYVDHGPQPVTATARPPSRLRTRSEPFLVKSTHRHDFQAWGVQPRRPNLITAGAYDYRPAPFCGESTTHASYTGEKGELRASFKPEYVLEAGRKPLETSTSYNEAYGEASTKHRFEVCPAMRIHRAQSAGPRASHIFSHQSAGHTFYAPTAVTVSQIDLSKVRDGSC